MRVTFFFHTDCFLTKRCFPSKIYRFKTPWHVFSTKITFKKVSCVELTINVFWNPKARFLNIDCNLKPWIRFLNKYSVFTLSRDVCLFFLTLHQISLIHIAKDPPSIGFVLYSMIQICTKQIAWNSTTKMIHCKCKRLCCHHKTPTTIKQFEQLNFFSIQNMLYDSVCNDPVVCIGFH